MWSAVSFKLKCSCRIPLDLYVNPLLVCPSQEFKFGPAYTQAGWGGFYALVSSEFLSQLGVPSCAVFHTSMWSGRGYFFPGVVTRQICWHAAPVEHRVLYLGKMLLVIGFWGGWVCSLYFRLPLTAIQGSCSVRLPSLFSLNVMVITEGASF